MKDAAGAEGEGALGGGALGGGAGANRRSARQPAKAFAMLECVPRAFGTDIH